MSEEPDKPWAIVSRIVVISCPSPTATHRQSPLKIRGGRASVILASLVFPWRFRGNTLFSELIGITNDPFLPVW